VIPKVVQVRFLPHPDGRAAPVKRLADADALSRVPEPAAARRRGGGVAVREPVVPGPDPPQPRALFALAPRAMKRRGAGRFARRSADRAGAGCTTMADLYHLTRPSVSKGWSWRRRSRGPSRAGAPPSWARFGPETSSRQLERSKANDLSRLVLPRFWHPPRWREGRRPRLSRRQLPIDGSGLMAEPIEALQVGVRNRSGGRGPRCWAVRRRNRANQELVRKLKAAGVKHGEPRRRRPADQPGPRCPVKPYVA